MRRTLIILLTMTLMVGGMAQAQGNDCRFTGTLKTLALYHAPLTHQTQIKDQLPGGTAYQVMASRGEHFLIAVDDAYGGWVDRRSGRLSGACDSVSVDSTPLVDFPTLCLFESQQAIPGFADARLSSPSPLGSVPANTPLLIGSRTNVTYEIIFDHAASVWVAANTGQAYGAGCLAAGRVAYVSTEARLWSHPDVRIGRVLATLAADSEVTINSPFLTGPIRFDTDATGIWVPVRQGNLNGWVWQERLTFSPSLPPINARWAYTRANARLWSQPDVHSGQLLTTLDEWIAVTVLDGPAPGPIRFDTAEQGDWLQVRVRDTNETGWVWAERLIGE
jgi:hypothetical protein